MRIDWRALSTEEAAALVCTTLDAAGITATLVGGACVMIYSRGEYVSHNLDFVSDAAFWYHWHDHQCLDQAVNIARSHETDMSEIARWSQVEGQLEKYKEFARILGPGIR